QRTEQGIHHANSSVRTVRYRRWRGSTTPAAAQKHHHRFQSLIDVGAHGGADREVVNVEPLLRYVQTLAPLTCRSTHAMPAAPHCSRTYAVHARGHTPSPRRSKSKAPEEGSETSNRPKNAWKMRERGLGSIPRLGSETRISAPPSASRCAARRMVPPSGVNMT